MGRYTNLPTLWVDFLEPTRMAFAPVGAAEEGGRNGSGDSSAIDLSGGPRLAGEYDFFIHAAEQHEIINMLMARMNGSIRFINVPLITDFVGPFPSEGGVIDGISHSDGSYFSDGSGYSQATVFGTFAEAAALNAGQIKVNIVNAGRDLRHADWMSTYHDDVGATPGKGWRAFSYWKRSDPVAVTVIVDGVEYDAKQYELAILPPLRQAVSAGQRIELYRPRFVAKFPPGFNLKWEVRPAEISEPTVMFIESEVR